ncbi:HAEPLYID family protein [Flavobacterium sp. UBA6135]|uniref:HAEPLYID family protein n=1 Tax=Flavobacterium sp. UBA6135 TaxID=1946553 RepID=UPI0025C740BD|nr:HAEPLYID family protein [Flavobacterium sp. UBA6135]
MKNLAVLFLLLISFISIAQENQKTILDSLYIQEVEQKTEKHKVLHAEPLYIDLIRDLGARKGEKEWNIGVGLIDNNSYDRYEALIEYEWAPVDRLGLEIEVPFSFYYNQNGTENLTTPQSKMESLKLAAQYTFFVSEKTNTSMALGYIHEFEMTSFKQYSSSTFFQGNVYNPFFVVAKRWGNNFHTLLYTGPVWEKSFDGHHSDFNWQINSNIHYMISGTRNFIGVEFNKEVYKNDFDMVIRPQMRLEISNQIMVGIVTGIPISRENQRFSSFLRLIYEPSH